MKIDTEKILIYTTPHLRSEYSFNGVRCWVPKSEDARDIISYLRKKCNKQLFIETILKEYSDERREEIFISLKRSDFRAKKIILYAQNDTLANSCAKVYAELIKQNVEVKLVVPAHSFERADDFFRKEQLPYDHFSVRLLKSFSPDVFMVGNDWTKEVHRVFSYCKQLKIPTVCLQESMLDFGDSMRRMRFADDVLMQGIHSTTELYRGDYYITGNPRYSSGRTNDPGDVVLVNCNFTYNIFEHERDNWLGGIQNVLSKYNLPYNIVQHPRDTGKIDSYGTIVRTNSETLPPLIKKSKFVITRFSSMVHEALAQNIPVVYYNPHGERMKYDFGFNDTFLRYARNQEELEKNVVYFKTYLPVKDDIASYLSIHCIPKDGSAAENIAFLLVNNHFSVSALKIKDLIYRVLYYPTILNKIKKIKRLLS